MIASPPPPPVASPLPDHTYTGWDLYSGIIQLVIVGPGSGAWFPCSKPEYRIGHKPGSVIEHNIARRACDVLNRRHFHDRDLSPKEIRAVWEQAARDLGHDPADLLR